MVNIIVIKCLRRPASKWANGSLEWFQNGNKHRDHDLPSVIGSSGSYWYKNNNVYRDFDLPAVVENDGILEWWTDGKYNFWRSGQYFTNNSMEILGESNKCIRYTAKETQVIRVICDNRFNHYLDFSDTYIQHDLWQRIEALFLANKIFPKITVINISNTNIKIDNVHPDLRHMIIQTK